VETDTLRVLYLCIYVQTARIDNLQSIEFYLSIYLYLPMYNMRNILCILACFVVKFEVFYCISLPIVDSEEAFPFLRSVDSPSQIMRWDSGSAVQLLSSCKLIRITRRGIRCIASTDHLISGWQMIFSSQYEAPVNGSYRSSICHVRNDALCVMDNGVRFFPTDSVHVSDKSLQRCSNGQRRILLGASEFQKRISHTNKNESGDDISLCDVLDTNLDVIYDPVNHYVFTRQLGNSVWLYACISIVIVAVVVLAAEAISQQTRSKLPHNIFGWTLLTSLSLLMLTHVDGRMHPFVTVEDRSFVAMSFIYISITTMYWVFSARTTTVNMVAAQIPDVSQTQQDGVNAMLGSIHFATCVLYGTPDNAYVSGFFFIFLFRCLQKLHDAHQNPEHWTMWANTIILFDMVYTLAVFSFGVIPHFTDDTETILFITSQYVICDTVAAAYVSSRKDHPSDPKPLASEQMASQKGVAAVDPLAALATLHAVTNTTPFAPGN